MRRFARSPLWPWVKVAVLVVALDWALFDAGLFFRLVPTFSRAPVTWGLVYQCLRTLAAPPGPPVAYAVGSSIVFLGLDVRRVRTALAERSVPGAFAPLTVFGATGVDQALLAHAAIPTHPWAVVLTASVRDVPRTMTDTPVSRVFFDSAVDLPGLEAPDVETRLTRLVRRHWQLYRYRFFVRVVLQDAAASVLDRLVGGGIATPPPPPGPLPVPSTSGAAVPEAAFEWFFPGRVSAESWAAWTHWRDTRRFADYEEFLRLSRSGAIEQYGRQTFATHGPDDNVNLDALAAAAAELQAAGIRVVILDFPENPVLQDAAARELYDTTLSDAVTRRLESDARHNGARFLDLRRLLDPEDFYDLIHPNLVGAQKLSQRLGDVLAEEWKARGQ